VVITEGEFKTLALSRLARHKLSDASERPRFLSVGLGGVWNWKGNIGKTTDADGARVNEKGPIPDLARITWKGRTVVIVFDVDIETNEFVCAARTHLTKELKRRGARVKWFAWPKGLSAGVKGIDDYLAAMGPEAAIQHIENAKEQTRERIRAVSELPCIYDISFESVRYLIEPELPEGGIVALTGDPECGKSSLATAWGRDLGASGRSILLLDRDNPLQVVRQRFDRLRVVGNSITVWGGWLPEEAPMIDDPRVLAFVRGSNPKPLVIVDSFSAFYGGDENNAAEMRRFMNRVRKVANLGATVVVIHHSGKSETSRDYRGSSDFRAAIDVGFSVINIGPNRKLDKIHLRCFKSRFGFTGGIVYRYDDGKMRRDEETHAVSHVVTQQLTELLRTNPGVTQNEFEKLAAKAGVGRDQARDFLRTLTEFGKIRIELGPRNSRRHYLKGDSE
jgi:hypothetical protein